MSSKTRVKGSTGPADVVSAGSEAGAETAVAPDTKEAVKAPTPRSRGPRGTEEAAVITLIATANPKRPNSKAWTAFSNYRSGMTIKEFADLVGKEATGHLVYDAKHGFISIAGYDPGTIVVPKERVAKEPKAKKEKAPKDATAEAHKAGVEDATQTESMA